LLGEITIVILLSLLFPQPINGMVLFFVGKKALIITTRCYCSYC